MRARLGPRVPPIAPGPLLGRAEHPQRVAAREPREVAVAPPAVGEGGEQPGVAADVLEAVGQRSTPS